MPRTKKPKCLRPDCPGEPAARGLCKPCYHAAKAAVKKGWATWEKLEEMGKILPRRTGRSCAAWPWLMDWSEDKVVQRQIASVPRVAPPPAEPRTKRGPGRPRKLAMVDPMRLTSPVQ